MLVLQRLTNEYIASIRKTLRAAKQDDCSRLLRLREQQTPAIFFRHLGFTAARYQRGHIARVSQIVKMASACVWDGKLHRIYLHPIILLCHGFQKGLLYVLDGLIY